MKFSIKSLKFLLGIGICICTQVHGSKLPGDGVTPQSRYTGTPLSDLIKLEYDRPDDPALKAELARLYWCGRQRGMAIEHWKWLENRSASSGKNWNWNWSELLEIARVPRKSTALETLLVCSTVRSSP